MFRSLVTRLLLPCVIVGLGASAQAGRTRTLGMVPDPSCRTSELVVPIEQALAEHLSAPGVRIVRRDPAGARLLLRYVLRVHPRGDEVLVQLDGEVFGNRSNKLLAEGSVRSDPHPTGDQGRTAAARQAAQRLAERLSAALAERLARPARGRSVMLQVSLGPAVTARRQAVEQRLRQALAGMSPRRKGSTRSNLMMTLFTVEPAKALAERIERALQADSGLQVRWQVQARSTLMLELVGEGS
jgi:hypothetical protein